MLAGLGVVAGDVLTLTVLRVVEDDAAPLLELPPHAASEIPSAATPATASSRLHVLLIRSFLLHRSTRRGSLFHETRWSDQSGMQRSNRRCGRAPQPPGDMRGHRRPRWRSALRDVVPARCRM